MAGHTPWTFGYVEDSSDWVVWGAEDNDGDPEATFTPAICTLSSSCGRDEARLIAAAPELLEALILLEAEMVLSGNAGSTDYGWKPAISKTRAAILRATQP